VAELPKVQIFHAGVGAGFGHRNRSRVLARALESGSSVSVCEDLPKSNAELRRILDSVSEPGLVGFDFPDNGEVDEAVRLARAMGWKTFAIADLPPTYPIDILICPGPHSETFQNFDPRPKVCLLGLTYGLVDDVFFRQETKRHDQIVVNLGGTLLEDDIRIVSENLSGCGRDVLLFSPLDVSIPDLPNNVRIICGASLKEISVAFSQSSFALTSAGVACLEAMAVGVPLGIISLNEVQQTIASVLQRQRLAYDMGPLCDWQRNAGTARHVDRLLDRGEHDVMLANQLHLDLPSGKTRVASFLLDWLHL
jgi:hypothetical protein